MGPAVSTLIHGDKKKKKSLHQSIDSSNDLDVSTMLFDRNFSQDDVTQQLPLFHSAKFPYISLNESPSYSDEPSMSSSIIQTPLVKEDATLYKQNVSEIASKIIPKRAWSGYHLFQLANMKGDPSQPPRIIKTPRFRSTGHKLASNLNTVNSSAPSLSSTTSQQTKPLLIIENTIDTEKGKEPAEMEQLISMMKNHKVSDDTASFDFNFGLNNNNKPLTPIPSPQSATTSFIPSPEFKFSFSASIPNTNHHYTYGYSTNTTIPNEEEDEYDDGNIAINGHYHYHKNEYYTATTNEGTENHLNNDTLYISERKILPLPKPRWKRHQDKSTTTIAIRTQDGSTNYPFNRVQDANNTSHLFNRIPSSNITLNEDMSNIKKMKCSAGNKVISNKQRQKVDNKRKERNWQDNVSSSSTTAEVTEIRNEYFIDSKKMGLHIPSSSSNHNLSINKPFNLKSSESMRERIKTKLKTIQATKGTSVSTAVVTIPSVTTNSTKKSISQKKKPIKNQTETNKGQKKIIAPPSSSTVKKKTNNKKRSNRGGGEDIAPGGFLSSDITLFENPISDDWICLFCQYDIFMHGLEEAKRKNGYYRRRRERLKRLKEAELRRLGSLSESEDDQHKEHICM